MLIENPLNTHAPQMSPEACDIGFGVQTAQPGVHQYVSQTQSHGENRAFFHLERHGYRIFRPRICKTVTHARKKAGFRATPFSSHPLLKLSTMCELRRNVNRTSDVVRLITHGGPPQSAPVGIAESIQSCLNADVAKDWTPGFKIGQSVRSADASFTDLVGETLNAGRARVLLDVLGCWASVALRCEALATAA
jgi:hypothetical protein